MESTRPDQQLFTSIRRPSLRGKGEGVTFHLSGIPGSAPGKPDLRVLWTIADVIATPQTMPRDRIRYTVDAVTAWSKKGLVGRDCQRTTSDAFPYLRD